jgi:trimeric autotransporter adhesin
MTNLPVLRSRLAVAALIAGLLPIAHAPAQTCEPAWSPVGYGADPRVPSVLAATVFDPPGAAPPVLVVGGLFDSIGGVSASDIAMWDGEQWAPLGAGISNGPGVLDLTTFDDGSGSALYAAGIFGSAGGKPARNIVKWDGQQWSPVGGGFGGFVRCMTTFDDGSGPALYVGGNLVGGDVFVQSVARWDGSSWSAVGNPLGYNTGYGLAVHDDGTGPTLYLGTSGPQVERWNGLEWKFISQDYWPNAVALESFDDGGGPALFSNGGDNALGRWDGQTWIETATVGGAIFELVAAPAPVQTKLLMLGDFIYVDDQAARGMAQWNDGVWQVIDDGPTYSLDQTLVADAVVYDDGGGPATYFVGQFDSVGGAPASSVARWGCPPCAADLDRNGTLDLFDFLGFVNLFNDEDPKADFNQDGLLDFFDFLEFTNAFSAGC